MKKLIIVFAGFAFMVPCFAGDPDMDAVMTVNASTAASNVPHHRWAFTSWARSGHGLSTGVSLFSLPADQLQEKA